jgi:hypothetical protein
MSCFDVRCSSPVYDLCVHMCFPKLILYDVQAPILIPGVNGRSDLLAIGQKSGMAWGIDPETGKPAHVLAVGQKKDWVCSGSLSKS